MELENQQIVFDRSSKNNLSIFNSIYRLPKAQNDRSKRMMEMKSMIETKHKLDSSIIECLFACYFMENGV